MRLNVKSLTEYKITDDSIISEFIEEAVQIIINRDFGADYYCVIYYHIQVPIILKFGLHNCKVSSHTDPNGKTVKTYKCNGGITSPVNMSVNSHLSESKFNRFLHAIIKTPMVDFINDVAERLDKNIKVIM